MDRTAVVIGRVGKLRQVDQHLLAARDRDIAVGGEAADPVVGAARGSRVVHVDMAVGVELRIEGQADEASFTARIGVDAGERRRQQRAVLRHPHRATLFGDEEPAVARLREGGGRVQTGDERLIASEAGRDGIAAAEADGCRRPAGEVARGVAGACAHDVLAGGIGGRVDAGGVGCARVDTDRNAVDLEFDCGHACVRRRGQFHRADQPVGEIRRRGQQAGRAGSGVDRRTAASATAHQGRRQGDHAGRTRGFHCRSLKSVGPVMPPGAIDSRKRAHLCILLPE